jgi:hypothetical protein
MDIDRYNELGATTIRRDQTNRIRFLRQSITLTGFGTATFEAGIKSLQAVHTFFDRHLPEGKLDECTIIDQCDDHFGIHLTNRYFTTRRESDSQTEQAIEFPTEVDPQGILTGLVSDQFVHTEQNEVKYYNRSVSECGAIKYVVSPLNSPYVFVEDNLRYETVTPVTFRVGDIVEAKATLMVLPLRGGNYKLTAVLRGITILDTTYTQV